MIPIEPLPKLLEDSNYLRRSARSKQTGKGRKSSSPSEEDESKSEDSSSDSEDYKRKSRKVISQKKSKKVSKTRSRGPKSSRSQVDYTEKGTDEDVGGIQLLLMSSSIQFTEFFRIYIQIDDNDVLEWEDDKKSPSSVAANAETIERVIKSRMGSVGATGSATTCYNVAEKGDPNDPSSSSLEQQFLIKYVTHYLLFLLPSNEFRLFD
ncbi:hypothetical protein COOONC_20395 [Cooperia oncophora]